VFGGRPGGYPVFGGRPGGYPVFGGRPGGHPVFGGRPGGHPAPARWQVMAGRSAAPRFYEGRATRGAVARPNVFVADVQDSRPHCQRCGLEP
jgi:hypothetical protein